MKLSNMTANEHDVPTITITLTGAHEIYRFAHHMEYGQCEFADAGRKIINRLKRRSDRTAWNRWVKPLREAEVKIFGVHKNDRDPIVWDGEDETVERIRDMLTNTPFDAGSDRGANEVPDDAPLCIWAGDEFQDSVDVLFPGDSITVNGRWPHVIRAEEVEP